MRDLARAAWSYRHFIQSSVKNELRVRFVRSKLGALWMVIHPLAQVLIFALILSEVLSAKLPGIDNKHAYALYLMAGTLCWTLFAEMLSKCLTLFIDNGNLMKKMAFPRICLPLIAAGISLVTNILLACAIFAVFAVLDHAPSAQVAWLPLLILVTLLLAVGVGLVLGVLNVFVRDIGQTVPVLLQALFWLTPIVYSLSILPERFQVWFAKNPLYPLVTSYQNVMVFGTPPDFVGLAWLAASGVGLLLIALALFRRANAEMVDLL
ncbi:ABC transporter permease [Tolypothrix campylonemoides VB511288]|nr:ABC transporter permease [Tolypothrix campylonemoides VB511288]